MLCLCKAWGQLYGQRALIARLSASRLPCLAIATPFQVSTFVFDPYNSECCSPTYIMRIYDQSFGTDFVPAVFLSDGDIFKL